MPRPGRNVKVEKAQNFGTSMRRLIKELKVFRVLIILSLVLAVSGSVLSIVSPNRLADMVDEISKGIVPDIENVKNIAQSGVSKEDQMAFFQAMQGLNIDPKKMQSGQGFTEEEQKQIFAKLDQLPESVKEVIKPKMDFAKIRRLAAIVAAIYITSALFTFIQNLSMTDVANRFAKKLRRSISEKINRLPLSYFDTNSVGDILSRVTNDIDTVAQSMNQSLASLVSAITLFLGTMAMMFYTNWIMALTAIISSMLGFAFMAAILSKSQKYFSLRQKSIGKLNGHIEEVYSGLNIVRAYNAKDQVMAKFDQANNLVYEANRKSQFLSGLMMPMMMFIGNFGYVAVCIMGAILTIKGHITFGVIIAFISYVRLFTSPLSQIGQAMTSLQSTAAAAERVFEFVDEKEMDDQREIASVLPADQAQGHISFKNVEFTYQGNSHPTIRNFSADIRPGQKIAIVGPTGAGKTTMVNLLMKFYEIDKGDIIIDGHSIHDLTRENIHDLFTMVLQDTWLFEGTIKENIVYNRPATTSDRLDKVIRAVGLDHFIRTLPKGMNSQIKDNDSVSSGQRQLLTIARAMIDDKPFLILDEATSNVDTRSEELVQAAMDKLAQGRTSFIIAHRLSTIRNADLILVMNQGDIIEQGTHEALMQSDGFYAKLYNSQFEL